MLEIAAARTPRSPQRVCFLVALQTQGKPCSHAACPQRLRCCQDAGPRVARFPPFSTQERADDTYASESDQLTEAEENMHYLFEQGMLDVDMAFSALEAYGLSSHTVRRAA